MTFKCVNFAYPTSRHAHKYGRADTGCWTIEVYDNVTGDKAVSGPYASRAEAEREAEALPEPWWDAYLRSDRPGSILPAYAAAIT